MDHPIARLPAVSASEATGRLAAARSPAGALPAHIGAGCRPGGPTPPGEGAHERVSSLQRESVVAGPDLRLETEALCPPQEQRLVVRARVHSVRVVMEVDRPLVASLGEIRR